MVRSDFGDAESCICAAYEPEEKEIVESITQFYKQAGDAGIRAERTRDILKRMVHLEYLVQKGIEYAEK